MYSDLIAFGKYKEPYHYRKFRIKGKFLDLKLVFKKNLQ